MSHHSYSSCCVHQCLGRCTPRCHEPRSCYRSCVRFQAVAVDGVGISIFNRYRSSCCCRCLVSTVRLPSAATAAAAAASFSSCQNACSTWFLQLLLLAKLVLPFVVAAARHLLPSFCTSGDHYFCTASVLQVIQLCRRAKTRFRD